MAVNMNVAILLIVLLTTIYLKQTRAHCELVPFHIDSCLDLVATPYITHNISKFGASIEGASVNPAGNMFAVYFGTTEALHLLGQFYPVSKLFHRDVNEASRFAGIRFLNAETAFSADAFNHRVVKLTYDRENVVTTSGEDYCSDPAMLQPNDIALSTTGTIYISGFTRLGCDTNATEGDIWSCLPDGTAKRLEVLGRTNGIELSPDERFLYVTETNDRACATYNSKIWRYETNIAQGTIHSKTLFADFEQLDNSGRFVLDGMRSDILGNLFVARYYGQHVAILSPEGKLIGKIALSFPHPSNCEFGGPNGTTLFIVGECAEEGKGCVDQIELIAPGNAWSRMQTSNAPTVLHMNNYSLTFLWAYVCYLVLLKE